MAAMQAEFQETIAKLREELTTRLRVEEAANRLRRERSLGTSFDGQGGGKSADRRGTAVSTMGPMWTRGVSTGGGLGRGLPYDPRDIVPKLPVECPPHVYIAWERRFEIFIANQGLRHTISPDAPKIAVISCINDAYLFGHFGKALVTDHRRVWGYISEATAGAPFEDRLYECHSVSDALRTMREWALPRYPAERHLLVAKLEGVQFMVDEDPKFFFARISRLGTTMRAVGIEKNESEIVRIILRQLPKRYDVVKTWTLAEPQLTRPKLENTIRSVYSQRNAHEIAKQWPAVGVPAEPSNPHALSHGGGMPRQQQQQQHWSRGGGMPRQQQQQQHWSRDGDMPRQQQQQQHWSRSGGMPRQQQQQQHWSRDGGMPRQQQQQQNWSLVACRGGSSNSINGLVAAPMFSLRPGRRDSSNRYSNRHGESLRSEVTGRTEVAPFLKLFSAVMAGLLRSGFSREMWRCRCSPCRRDRSSQRRRQWYLLQQHLRLKR